MPTSENNMQKNEGNISIISLICAIAFFGMTGGSLIAPTLSTMAGPLNVEPERVGLILAS
ncbi:MAG: MFS transporter [Firmicutes bacterium]|nr:MFS transporter [Bacillota bacterium]